MKTHDHIKKLAAILQGDPGEQGAQLAMLSLLRRLNPTEGQKVAQDKLRVAAERWRDGAVGWTIYQPLSPDVIAISEATERSAFNRAIQRLTRDSLQRELLRVPRSVGRSALLYVITQRPEVNP